MSLSFLLFTPPISIFFVFLVFALLYIISTLQVLPSRLLFSLGGHRLPPLAILLSVALPVSPRTSLPFPPFIFPGQQACWQHVTTGGCTRSMSPFPHLTLWKYTTSIHRFSRTLCLCSVPFRSVASLWLYIRLSVRPPQVDLSLVLLFPFVLSCSVCTVSLGSSYMLCLLLSSLTLSPHTFPSVSFPPCSSPSVLTSPSPSDGGVFLYEVTV